MASASKTGTDCGCGAADLNVAPSELGCGERRQASRASTLLPSRSAEREQQLAEQRAVDAAKLVEVVRARRAALDRLPAPPEIVMRTWPRYRRTRETTRYGGAQGMVSVFGERVGTDGGQITRRLLRDENGVRYRMRHRIGMSGDRKVVESEIAQYSSTTVDAWVEDIAAFVRSVDTPVAVRSATLKGRPAGDNPSVDSTCGCDPGATELDGGDVWTCNPLAALFLPGPTWRDYAWLDDLRAASGVEQFRYSSSGPLTGANPGWGGSAAHYGARMMALYDSTITRERVVFGPGNERIELLSGHEPEDDPHGMEMAGVMAADGTADVEVEGSWHEGMAPEAHVFVFDRGSYAIDDAANLAGWAGMDVLASAASTYRQKEDDGYAQRLFMDCVPDNDEDLACNDWSEDERAGRGREIADALDAAFSTFGLQAVLSAGNLAGMCYSDDLHSMGLGRSSFSSIAVGAIYATHADDARYNTAPALSASMSRLERADEIQGVNWVRSYGCGNYHGPTGDERVYPLILGLTESCGVPTWQFTISYDDASGRARTYTYEPEGEAYYRFHGTSGATAMVAGAFTILKEWLDIELGDLGADDAALYRVTFLNMGDRSGAYASDELLSRSCFATSGLPRHGGLGKVRLRLADGCHFNDGGTEFHSWEIDEAGESYVAELSGDPFAVERLPDDLDRIRLLLWFELDSATVETADDRPLALVMLQRRSSIMADWQSVATTWNGEEFVPDSAIFVSNYLYYPTRDIRRDPHASIALDNEWDEYGATARRGDVEGGGLWRVVVLALRVPLSPVTAHLHVLWESGRDPSMGRNRSFGWRCPTSVRGAPDPTTGAGATAEIP